MNQAPYSIKGFDHCEFYVGNAKQTAYFYNRTMGFNTIAYRGLETGSREKVSYVLNQGKIFLVVTSPMIKDTEIGHHIDRHGDGIKDVALTVDDAEMAWKSCIERGAKSAMSPLEVKDENGQAVMASIHTFGDTIHTFIERNNYKGSFLPGYSEYSFGSETLGNCQTLRFHREDIMSYGCLVWIVCPFHLRHCLFRRQRYRLSRHLCRAMRSGNTLCHLVGAKYLKVGQRWHLTTTLLLLVKRVLATVMMMTPPSCRQALGLFCLGTSFS